MLNNQHPMLPTRAAVARALYTNREKRKKKRSGVLKLHNIIPQNICETHSYKIQTKKQIESKSSKRITQQIRGAHSCIPEIKWRWERLSFTFQLLPILFTFSFNISTLRVSCAVVLFVDW